MKQLVIPTFWTLRIVVGGIFIASGLLKLYPIEPFELTLIDAGLFTWKYSPIVSRLIISAEIILGILIAANIYYNRFAFKATSLLLIVFSFYIVYLLFIEGEGANCGCMGASIQLTPFQSLFKNGLLFFGLIFLKGKGRELKPSWKWIVPGVLVVSALPFILNPVQLGQESSLLNNEEPYKIELSAMPQPINVDRKVDYTSGEKILAFFLVKCVHCKDAARKLSIVDEQYGIPEVYCVFKSNNQQAEEFLKASKADFPFIIFQDQQFFKMARGIFPTVLFLKDGLVYKQWTGETLTNFEMEKFSDLRGHYLR